ncbi:MAG: hypothetical protein ACRCYO_07655 [Bacteroidia bacterium]
MLKRIVLTLCCLPFLGLVHAQMNSGSTDVQVNTSIPEPQSMQFDFNAYSSQENYWQQQTTQNRNSAAAWSNYYKAKRYRMESANERDAQQAELDALVTEMGRYVATSFEYHYIRYWNSDHDLSLGTDLMLAYAMQPQNAYVLRQLAGYYTLRGEKKEAGTSVKNWEKTNQMPACLMPYAYNVLQSTAQGAILFTNGDFDAFPILAQQSNKQVREDVQVVVLGLMKRPENRARMLRQAGLVLPENDSVSVFDATYMERLLAANLEKKIYFSMTLERSFLQAFQANLFPTGLAFRYGASVENLAFLRENVGVKMKLSYLNTTFSKTEFDRNASAQLQLNYVLPLVLAAAEYEKQGNKKRALELRELARGLGRAAGKESVVNDLIGEE